MDLQTVGGKRLLQLNGFDEFLNNAYENAKIYKDKSKALHDKLIIWKEFELGQQVLIFNSRLRLFTGKLESRWPKPFIVTQVFPHRRVEVMHPEKGTFKVNGQRLKPYFKGGFNESKTPINLETL